MRHPSKVGAFCARKMYRRTRGKLNDKVLGSGKGPPTGSRFRRKGKSSGRSYKAPSQYLGDILAREQRKQHRTAEKRACMKVLKHVATLRVTKGAARGQ